MAVNLSPIGGVAGQFFDNNGNPLAGGKIFTYAAGTTTNQATYTSASGVIAHSNPIILDAAGRVPSGEIWLTDGLQYKFVIKTSLDVLIGTFDNIAGINSNFINFLAETEIQTATAGQTVFTLTTMQYQPNTNSLSVFVDGVNQYDGVTYAYVETSSTVVTFNAGLHVGALVKFTTTQTLSSGVTDAALVVYDPNVIGAVATTVQAKLREIVTNLDYGDGPSVMLQALGSVYGSITTLGNGASVGSSAVGYTHIGKGAGTNSTGDDHTAVGKSAGQNNTGIRAVHIGQNAGTGNIALDHTAVGETSGTNNTGTQSTQIGGAAGQQNTGAQQTAVGLNAGRFNTGAVQTVVGKDAGISNSGARCVGYGFQAARENTGSDILALGYSAGYQNTGDFCVFIGRDAGTANATDYRFELLHSGASATPFFTGNLQTKKFGLDCEYDASYTQKISNSGVDLSLLESTSVGTGIGPVQELYRNKIGSAVSDELGAWKFTGNNSAGAKVEYARINAQIVDNTAGSEDISLRVRTQVAGTLTDQMRYGNGVTIGAAAGGFKGTGTLNTSGDIYKNDSAFTNPDYVFEHTYTGQIVQFAGNAGASSYAGRKSIDEIESITKATFKLPGLTDTPLGVFERADVLLEKLEEAYLCIFELNARLKKLEKK